MWGMNGLSRNTAGVVLLLCALLFSGKVIGQDDDSDAAPPSADPPAAESDAPSLSADEGQAGVPSVSPDDDAMPTLVVISVSPDSTGVPVPADDDKAGTPAVHNVPEIKPVIPDVKCVGKETIPESSAVKAVVSTGDCEGTKRIITENPAAWCDLENCSLEIFQEGNTMLVASNDAKLSTLAEVLQSEHLKDKLGVTKTETPSSSGSSVFVGILITGLLVAAAIVVGYLKCQRKPAPKEAKLAEEDVENQGNTLASAAPLNPPPETQEKPSVNGESPEADKTQTPPTNGHSTAKTADTEL